MSKQTAAAKTTAKTTVADAEATLAELTERARLLAQARTQLEAERKATAYAAHAQHDPEANKRLAGIVDALVRHDADTAALNDAITEAEKRLEWAKREATAADEKKQALQLRRELRHFTDAASRLDAAFEEIAEVGNAFFQIAQKMRLLGADRPTATQLDALGYRCLLTAVGQSPWHRRFEIVPPSERRSFATLTRIWVDALEQQIEQRLAAATKQEAA
jgi:hypothetical protein